MLLANTAFPLENWLSSLPEQPGTPLRVQAAILRCEGNQLRKC